MPCTIVVGGQYGSEGKGKVMAFLAGKARSPLVVRCGGPNAGHSISFRGQTTILRHIPAGVDNPGATLLLCAGCVIEEQLLIREIQTLQLRASRIVVDPMAVLMSPSDIEQEKRLLKHVSSTFSGTGAATLRRIGRSADVQFAKDSKLLKNWVSVEKVAPLLHEQLRCGGEVLIEGTQGFGLSLLHGYVYPYVTSRDTTAGGCIMEAGIPPKEVTSVFLVIRTLPIRVGTNGPLPNEIDWEEARKIAGAPNKVEEYGSVTGRLRRVARFDIEAVKLACRYNGATAIAIMGLDRFDYCNVSARSPKQLTPRTHAFLREVQEATSVPVKLVGIGPAPDALLWMD